MECNIKVVYLDARILPLTRAMQIRVQPMTSQQESSPQQVRSKPQVRQAIALIWVLCRCMDCHINSFILKARLLNKYSIKMWFKMVSLTSATIMRQLVQFEDSLIQTGVWQLTYMQEENLQKLPTKKPSS